MDRARAIFERYIQILPTVKVGCGGGVALGWGERDGGMGRWMHGRLGGRVNGWVGDWMDGLLG